MQENIYHKIDELCRCCTKELTQEESAALLSQVLRHILETMQGSRNLPHVSFRQATEARLKAAEHRRPHTQRTLNSYVRRFLRYAPFADAPMESILTEECSALLEAHFAHSPHVFRKAYSALHSIFSYAGRKGWCEHNPTSGIDLPPVQEQTLTPLRLPQIRALLRSCGNPRMQGMNAPLRLMLWCGVRPTEVQRLRWGDIDRSERCIYVESHASKTGGARAIPLRGGAYTLLKEHHAPNELLAPRDWQRRWAELRRRACLIPWRQDTLRHTFASMHLKHFHNLPLLQEEMGHSNTHLLRTRYLNLRHISSADAARFFSPQTFSEAMNETDFHPDEHTLTH